MEAPSPLPGATQDSTPGAANTHYINDGYCVENRRWTYKGVTYATFDVQGSCNNLCPSNQFPDPAEYAARNTANIHWLDETFAEAKAQGSAGVMLISQADPGFDDSDATRAPTRNPITLAEDDANSSTDGYQTFLQAVRSDTIDYGKPVVYVHGDSHYFRVDKPLADADTNTGSPPTGSGSRTSPAWRRSATTPRPARTTCSG